MPDFYVTFGQKYRQEPHLRFREAHPDGWVRIVAHTRDRAREIAFALLKPWAGLYAAVEFRRELYPRGELMVYDYSYEPADYLEVSAGGNSTLDSGG